jgi:hypothetical protein
MLPLNVRDELTEVPGPNETRDRTGSPGGDVIELDRDLAMGDIEREELQHIISECLD